MPNNIEFYIIIGFFGLIVFSIGLSLLLGAFSILVTFLAVVIKVIKGIYKIICFMLTPLLNKVRDKRDLKHWERFMNEYPGERSAKWDKKLKKLVPMTIDEMSYTNYIL